MSMYGYLFRRLLGTIPVMLVVAVFIFLMLRLTPSDPAAIIAGLPPDPRPLPTVTAYDELLVRRTPGATPTDPDDTEKSTAS